MTESTLSPNGELNLKYPSLSSLRGKHSELLQSLANHQKSASVDGGAETDDSLWFDVEAFVKEGVQTGIVLGDYSDRLAAQTILEFWASTLGREKYREGGGPTSTLDEFEPQRAPELSECPYIGLDAFRDDKFFYGRQRLLDKLLLKLQETSLLAIIGSSGSGKSSLAMGGLLPALKKGLVAGSEKWQYLSVMVPGQHPLNALARVFPAPPETDAKEWERDLAARLRSNSETLSGLASSTSSGEPSVLLVDQFEEVFSVCEDREARKAFLGNLLSFAKGSPTRNIAILTMRSDFKTFVIDLEEDVGPPGKEFKELFDLGQFAVGALEPPELRDAIVKPAEAVGLNFESGVVDALVNDMAGEDAALPLLQFTLRELWDKRTRNLVTYATYKEIGGGRRALERAAENFSDKQNRQELEALQQILLRLVQPSGTLEFTSNRVKLETVFKNNLGDDRIKRMLRKLHEQRLIRFTGSGSIEIDEWLQTPTVEKMPPDVQVEVAHEAVVRNWPTLGKWLEAENVELLTRRRLEAKAIEWDRLGGKKSGLLDDIQLKEAVKWTKSSAADRLGYNDRVDKLVAASQVGVRHSTWLKRAAIVGLCIAVVAFASLFIFANRKRIQANKSSEIAIKSSAIANSSLLAARSQQSLDHFDLSLLLSVQALSVDPNDVTRGSLFQILSSNPSVTAIRSDHKSEISDVAINSDGVIVSIDKEGLLVLWDPQKPREVIQKKIAAPDDHASNFLLSPNGAAVAFKVSPKRDGNSVDEIVIWDIATKQLAKVPLPVDKQERTPTGFSSDGKLLGIIEGEAGVFVWNVGTKTSPLRIPEQKAGEFSIPNVKVLLGSTAVYVLTGDEWGESNELQLDEWKLTTPQKHSRKIPKFSSFDQAELSPDGHYLAITNNKKLALWDIQKHKLADEEESSSDIASVDFSADMVITLDKQGHLTAYDAKDSFSVTDLDQTKIATVLGARLTKLVVGANRKFLAALNVYNSIVVLSLETTGPGGLVENLDFGDEGARGSSYNSESHILASREGLSKIQLWDLSSDRPKPTGVLNFQRPSETSSSFLCTAISQDGKTVAACNNSNIALFKNSNLQEVPQNHEKLVRSIALSPDGRLMVSIGTDEKVLIWNLEGVPRVTDQLDYQKVKRVLFNPVDKKTFVSASDTSLYLWDIEQLRPVHELISKVSSLAYSPDGEFLAVGTQDQNQILILKASTLERFSTLGSSSSPVFSLAFNHNGDKLLSAGNDGTVTLWDKLSEPASRYIKLSFPLDVAQFGSQARRSPAAGIRLVAFDRNDRNDSTILAFPNRGVMRSKLDVDKWKDAACRIAGRNLSLLEWKENMAFAINYQRTCGDMWPKGEGAP
jgi:WD40 repeat protein/energy-coupling factor transporter ATP-binding protein EcfA2